jgi:predicted ArsR family transcriptional regulator
MTTARQKVLTYFEKNRTASARELSRALKMSTATVRHHLRIMANDGRLEMASLRGREGRGRPEKVYSLPPAVLGDNYSALANALLSEAGARIKMEAVARRLAGDVDLANQPIARRLNLVVEKLNQMNYHARWEAGAQGPRIMFGHCPYGAIVSQNPKLCEMDVSLLAELSGRPVVNDLKPETQKSGCPFVFLVR